MFRNLFTLVVLTTLSACSTIEVSDYRDATPRLTAATFFDGKLSAHGVVKNRAGRVIRHFNAEIDAYWRDGIGTLEEDFLFDDGEEQRRVWTLTPQQAGRYTATAADVVGDGVLQQAGNSIFLDYVLRIPYGDGTIDVRVDDRMYLVENQVLINESRLTKFGVEVGQLLLTIIRHPDGLL